MTSFRFLNQDARDALNFDYLEADKKMILILIVHAFFAIFVTSQYYDTHQMGVMVVAEAVVLSYIIHAQTDQFLKIIRTQKALDHSNTKLEELNLHLKEEVRLRTADLE